MSTTAPSLRENMVSRLFRPSFSSKGGDVVDQITGMVAKSKLEDVIKKVL